MFGYTDYFADANGVNGNGIFVSVLGGVPIVHLFSSESLEVQVPEFPGIDSTTVAGIKPANVKYRKWLSDIRSRLQIDVAEAVVEAEDTIEVDDERVVGRFVVHDGPRLLRATWDPTVIGGQLNMRRHGGGVVPFATAWRWSYAIKRFIEAVERFEARRNA